MEAKNNNNQPSSIFNREPERKSCKEKDLVFVHKLAKPAADNILVNNNNDRHEEEEDMHYISVRRV